MTFLETQLQRDLYQRQIEDAKSVINELRETKLKVVY